MTTTRVPQTFIDDLKRITRTLTVEAHSTDTERRANASHWLGQMKHDGEQSIRHPEPRSPGNEALHQIAAAQLPVIDDFIAYSADTDNLIHIIEGMVYALNNDATEPPLPTANPNPNNQAPTPALLNLIRDINQTNDPSTQRRTALQISNLKHDNEYALRNPDEYAHSYGQSTDDLLNELAVIDQLIAQADDGQLRNIIAGFTAHIRA